MCTRPWENIVPTVVFLGSMYGRICSKISFVVLTGPVQITMSDCGSNSAGLSDTLSKCPVCVEPSGSFATMVLLANFSGRDVRSCTLTLPCVFPSMSAAQTWPLFPPAISVTTWGGIPLQDDAAMC